MFKWDFIRRPIRLSSKLAEVTAHYAMRYTTELGVNSSQPCGICHMSVHSTQSISCTRYNCPIHTGTVCDSEPIACQIQIN